MASGTVTILRRFGLFLVLSMTLSMAESRYSRRRRNLGSDDLLMQNDTGNIEKQTIFELSTELRSSIEKKV